MKKILLALACCSIFASCVKEEDKKVIDVSKTPYLMAKSWQLKAYIWLPDINDSASVPVDMYGPMLGCQKDDYLVFNTKNRASIYEGNIKCAVTNADSVVYGYSLRNDDKYLEMLANPDEATPTIYLAGDVTFPHIDSFIVTYLAKNPDDTAKTSRYTKKYARIR